MKKTHSARNTLIIIIIIMACFFSINSIIGKKTVLAEDKAPSNKANISDNIVYDKKDDVNDSNADDSPSLEGTTYKDENNNTVLKNTDDILVLVNKRRNLPSNYIPKDLVIPNVDFSFKENLQKKYMRKDAARSLEELFSDAKRNNINLYAVSGYRSYQRQDEIFESKAKRYGYELANKTSAVAGQSEHQTGLAMDVSCSSVKFQLTEQFGQTVEGKWIKENAHKFGFIIRYPKDKVDITGYSYEPWHLRYVGKEAAKLLNEKNITLEEYFNESDTTQ